ncbi:AAA family ATPase [Maledivibacter halophilus]|uniref:DNA-binding transcriptional activator of the SARP family n=1 Tax=Maledivibacter halophilus TaxID=36842 RepID=A0A1T5MA13_9FIRM|nr:AAA family ATPase [Maledivibacter halophilus]SKC84834.1 DNA-binding transcriptional activator of the SARP family [Maledivibacter halophilus]
MVTINAKLFGTPRIMKNNKQITFPYSKAEALFYYLLVEKVALRDKLVNLFWGNSIEKSAKKNLRNAVYIIKKEFNEDVLVSPKRSIIQLNTDIDFNIDLEEFLYEKGQKSLKAYKGEFLEGFLVKDADGFENWMINLKNQYKEIFIKKLHSEINNSFKCDNLLEAEKLCKELIRIEEFDESAYRLLIEVYRKQDRYNKCIEIYNSLVKLLEEELSISPDPKTTNLFDEVLKERSTNKVLSEQKKEEFFYGRKNELKELKDNYFRFQNNKKAKSIIILGEAGIGKSKLLNRFLDFLPKDKVNIFITHCYRAEENFFLKPWNEVFQQLSKMIDKEKIEIPSHLAKIIASIFPTFNSNKAVVDVNSVEKMDLLKYEIIEEFIVDTLIKISKSKKIILVFDDLQWADNISLILLKNIILKNRNQNIILMATCRESYEENIENFLTDMFIYDIVKKIDLKRFTKTETIEMIMKKMPKCDFDLYTKELIYRETEGNALFIVELLNNMKENNNFTLMTSKMQNILKSRFLNVSKEGRKILSIASVFFDKVTFEYLQKISQKNELELIEIIEELQFKCLFKERLDSNDDVVFIFTHQKLREFIYSELSISKKRIIHKRIAKLLEKELRNDNTDVLLYSKLIYHYKNSGNKFMLLNYSIKNLDKYLNFNQEVFPVISYSSIFKKKYLEFNRKEIMKQLNEIDELFKEVKKDCKNMEGLMELEILFLHMLGRYYIRKGDYNKGVKTINDMIEKAQNIGSFNLALKGYLEKIYYCINIYNVAGMSVNIKYAFDMAKKKGEKGDIGVLFRLEGLQKIMEHKYEKGESLLNRAIRIFNSMENKDRYILNIAAAYNYIGESKRYRMEFEKAIKYYEKAISLCEKRDIVGGLTIFNTNAGQASYDMKEYAKARAYFNRALEIYKQFNFLWGRSTANGYLCLLLVKEGECDKAFQHLKKAEKCSEKLKNPYEIGILFKIKALIAKEMKCDNRVKSIFREYLNAPIEFYCNKGIEHMKQIKYHYEIEEFKRIKTFIKSS